MISETRIVIHGGAKPPQMAYQNVIQSQYVGDALVLLTTCNFLLYAFTLSQPNLAWRYETSGQSKLVIGWNQTWNHDVIFADVIQTNFKLLNLPNVYIVFERTIQGKLKAEKIFSVSQIWAEIWDITNCINPFWWREPLWRHNLIFCVKQNLASLVEKWKEM